ncbi:MAG: metal ABC transporter substrate-binding protein [Armatimonadota bacterium]|nr:metal ABC transporter substrate-binding protein [Armatimonadota bacterium]
MMKTLIRCLVVIFACCTVLAFGTSRADAAVDVVASTPELASIAKYVGGSKVTVYSIAKPDQDYHLIEPRPSDVSRIAKADLVVRVGLDLDLWFDALLNAAANPKVRRGAAGYVDASRGVDRLEVPKGKVTGASGDIHIYGNPHYYYDPQNAKIIARNICEGLARVSARDRDYFEDNYKRFVDELEQHISKWQQRLKPYKGKPVVTYHRSASYFIRRFGLRYFGQLEPKPGIPPSPSHISQLIKHMKEENVKALVVESIYPKRFPDLVAREVGIKYQVVPYSVGSMGTKTYIDLIDAWVERFAKALE